MIKNNKFYFNELRNVVILGNLESLEVIKKINDSLKLNTFLITSPSFKNNSKNIKIKIFKKLNNSFLNYIKSNFNIEKTLFVSFGPRWIFKKNIINKLFKKNLVNFHSSRLPIDAGGGGFSWRIMKNDRLGNCLVHLVDECIDTGPILKNKEFIFSNDFKTPMDFEKQNTKYFHAFYKSFIMDLKLKKKIQIKYQSQNLRRYNPRLDTKINGWIDWFNSSNEIFNFINAFDEPYPGASTFVGKNKVRLKQVHLHGGEINGHSFSTGIIIRKNKDWIIVSTTDNNCLIIEKVLNSMNQNIIKTLREGDRFFTPVSQLVSSRSKRVFYNSISKKSFIKK